MSGFTVPLSTSSSQLNATEFWNGVTLYHTRPHLINRKLLAASQVLFYKVCCQSIELSKLTELFTRPAVLYEMRKLKNISKEHITEQFIKNLIECDHQNIKLLLSNEDDFANENIGLFISIRILLPRNKSCGQCIEIVLLNKTNNTALFLAVTEFDNLTCAPHFPYVIELTNNFNLRINLTTFEDADTASAEWLVNSLFPRLLKWAIQEDKVIVKSLSLIGVDDYSYIYQRLKQEYADNIILKWSSKTTTDPQKYVFEDLALASYLICLWKEYKKTEINFVDCGCGNGLLVYLLNKEGYKGCGIDVRRRPIWDIYSEDTILQTGVITPSTTFPKATWIIGNHSDELTPWVPVIALKSSQKTNYFVLPCCPYDFSGKKYIRQNTAVSQYSDYLQYIEMVSNKCGFDTKIDKLRIPSTKKICLVGQSTCFSSDTRESLIKQVDDFITLRSNKEFSARSNVEQVRNCTQLNKGLLQKMVYDIVQLLLKKENFIKKDNCEDWNKGGILSMSSICKELNQNDLKELKNECGGVQTLLRNHRYLFELQKGNVNLRLPYLYRDVGEKYRKKPCWYFHNHQNGCLFSMDKCAYMH